MDEKIDFRWWHWMLFACGWIGALALVALVILGTPSGLEAVPGRPDKGMSILTP